VRGLLLQTPRTLHGYSPWRAKIMRFAAVLGSDNQFVSDMW